MFLHLLRRRALLVYPVPPPPPTAVLVPWVRPGGVVRVFPGGWDAAAAAFQPAAIAATWPQWESLLPEPVRLTNAAIVLARTPGQLLTEARRERLWRAFRVPVFEQILAEDGTALAAECEAHHGLHIESPQLAAEADWIDTHPCGCGRKTPRLQPIPTTDGVRAVAAYAR